MKITATYEEICELLTTAVGARVTEFSVKKTGNDLYKKCLEVIQGLDYQSTQKIEAIKRLRELMGVVPDNLRPGMTKCVLSLPDAKWAVENWEKWIGFIKVNGCLPKSGYGYSNVLTKH